MENLGLVVFLDVQGLDGGDVFPDVLDREVKSAGAVLGLWSPLALSRPWIKMECMLGKDRGVLIPVAIEPINPLTDVPLAFYGVQHIDLVDFDGDTTNGNWQLLLKSLARTLDRPELISPREEQPAQLVDNPTHLREEIQQMRAELAALRDNPSSITSTQGVGGKTISAISGTKSDKAEIEQPSRLIPISVVATSLLTALSAVQFDAWMFRVEFAALAPLLAIVISVNLSKHLRYTFSAIFSLLIFEYYFTDNLGVGGLAAHGLLAAMICALDLRNRKLVGFNTLKLTASLISVAIISGVTVVVHFAYLLSFRIVDYSYLFVAFLAIICFGSDKPKLNSVPVFCALIMAWILTDLLYLSFDIDFGMVRLNDPHARVMIYSWISTGLASSLTYILFRIGEKKFSSYVSFLVLFSMVWTYLGDVLIWPLEGLFIYGNGFFWEAPVYAKLVDLPFTADPLIVLSGGLLAGVVFS